MYKKSKQEINNIKKIQENITDFDNLKKSYEIHCLYKYFKNTGLFFSAIFILFIYFLFILSADAHGNIIIPSALAFLLASLSSYKNPGSPVVSPQSRFNVRIYPKPNSPESQMLKLQMKKHRNFTLEFIIALGVIFLSISPGLQSLWIDTSINENIVIFLFILISSLSIFSNIKNIEIWLVLRKEISLGQCLHTQQ